MFIMMNVYDEPRDSLVESILRLSADAALRRDALTA